MKLKDAIEKRTDVKHYDLRKPDWRKVLRAIDYARFAPSVGNYFCARFILVTDEGVIDKLTDACQQEFIRKAKVVVVVVNDDSSLVRSYGDRGEDYGKKHVGAVIENFLLGLEEQNLATKWVWYFVDDQVRRLLGIPEKVKVEGIFPIGKSSKIVAKEKRVVKFDNIMYFGQHGEKKMTPKVKVSREAV